MAPTWMVPRQTAHSVQPAPLPQCLTSLLYMNVGTAAATALSGSSSSGSAETAEVLVARTSAVGCCGRRCARCLHSETRAKEAATDAVTEQKRRLSGDTANCMAPNSDGDGSLAVWLRMQAGTLPQVPLLVLGFYSSFLELKWSLLMIAVGVSEGYEALTNTFAVVSIATTVFLSLVWKTLPRVCIRPSTWQVCCRSGAFSGQIWYAILHRYTRSC
jgi:hypothetical protein